MQHDKKNNFDPADLPQKEVFTQKEIDQHPQPPNSGPPLNGNEGKSADSLPVRKEQEKTSKDEGLNEERSAGNAGAFEGLEDQQ